MYRVRLLHVIGSSSLGLGIYNLADSFSPFIQRGDIPVGVFWSVIGRVIILLVAKKRALAFFRGFEGLGIGVSCNGSGTGGLKFMV